MAVVILHVHKYEKKKVTRKFKSGGLYEKHVVTTWKLGNHLSIRLKTQGNQEKPVSIYIYIYIYRMSQEERT